MIGDILFSIMCAMPIVFVFLLLLYGVVRLVKLILNEFRNHGKKEL